MSCLDFFSSLPKLDEFMSGGEGMFFRAKNYILLAFSFGDSDSVATLFGLIH